MSGVQAVAGVRKGAGFNPRRLCKSTWRLLLWGRRETLSRLLLYFNKCAPHHYRSLDIKNSFNPSLKRDDFKLQEGLS